MAIIKNLEVTVLSNQQPCMEYEYPSDEGRFQTTAFKHVVSTTAASLEIELESRPSFQFTSFDALLFDIHLDGRLVHWGLLEEGNKKAIMKDITREENGRWKIRSFNFTDVQAQDSRKGPVLPPCSAAHSDPPPTSEPRSSADVDPSSIGSEPRHSGPWKDLTYANRKETRYLAPEPGTIQIQAYRVKDLKANPATKKKDSKADAITKRSVAEQADRMKALQSLPQPLELHGNEIEDRNLTHTVECGAARNASKSSLAAPINKLYLDAVDQPWASFIFCYRSKEVLESWDVRLPRGVGVPWHERVLTGKSVFGVEEGDD